jgi:hypothetical protein
LNFFSSAFRVRIASLFSSAPGAPIYQYTGPRQLAQSIEIFAKESSRLSPVRAYAFSNRELAVPPEGYGVAPRATLVDPGPDDQIGLEAQKHWRRLQGFELIPKVVTGVRFVDGEEQTQQAA